MNLRLVFMLSLFGLFMGLATVFFISSAVEPFLWLAIFILCAYIIANRGRDKAFLNGLLLGIFNSVWVIASHIILMDKYLDSHPQEKEMLSPDMPAEVQMILMGLLIGVVSGIVIGLFSLIAKRFTKPAIAN